MEAIYYDDLVNEYPKFKPFELALIHIYQNHPDKPYRLRGTNISIFQKFYAVNEKSHKLFSVIASTPVEGKELLHKNFKKGTKKYEEWQKDGFILSYEPFTTGRSSYIISRMKEDFPEIKDPSRYFSDLFDEYKRILNSRVVKRRRS